MADRRSAWFLHWEEWTGAHGGGLHDKTCHFCRQCNGDWCWPGGLLVGRENSNSWRSAAHLYRRGGNKEWDNVYSFVITFPSGWLPLLANIIIRILIRMVNVLHLISPAGRPFVTPWHSITRELSLCGNLSRAQRRVSVTAQLAPRAGGPQVATAGTVSFHSDLPPGEPRNPGELPAERANGVTTGRQLQVAAV